MARWGELVKRMLLKQTAKVATSSPRKHFRVSAPLRKVGTEHAYNPEFVSLGPNHFRKPEAASQAHCEDLMMYSINERYKVNSAAKLCHEMNIRSKQWRLDDIVNEIELMRPQIESFYDWSNTDEEYRIDLGLMMAVDSFFILQILFGHGRRAHHTQIKCDIVKLENQIPLCVLKQVFDKVKEAILHPDLYRHILYYQDSSRINRLMLQRACKELSPFDITPAEEQIDSAVEKEPHLLGCIHAIISRFLPIQQHVQAEKGKPNPLQKICNYLALHVVEKMCRILHLPTYNPGDFPIDGYTAEELGKAGIKFKAFSDPSSQYIWFDKYSHRLILPRMIVTSPTHTEAFFKNLLAFESRNAGHNDHVRHFIQLMDALIDTSRDIRKLRKSGVIRVGSALPDESLMKSWDKVHQPFSSGHLEPPDELKQALDEFLTERYCIIKCRILISKYLTPSGIFKLFSNFIKKGMI